MTIASSLTELAGNALVSSSVRFTILEGLDSDRDGLLDVAEGPLGLDPNIPDTNRNGILDGEEDSDSDQLQNAFEAFYGLNGSMNDSDGDGTLDALRTMTSMR